MTYEATTSERELQLHFPLEGVAWSLRWGMGHPILKAGLDLMRLITDNEVHYPCGEHYDRRVPEQALCRGLERRFLVVVGQKV